MAASLTLLCTFHHTLVHEGGFKICRDGVGAGAIYFQRPDGRVIPRFGYRRDDVCDDYAVDEDPSTEVCDCVATYVTQKVAVPVQEATVA